MIDSSNKVPQIRTYPDLGGLVWFGVFLNINPTKPILF